jgi:ubiquinone/menaquinone biosynthesis C-methylase UbiE
LKPETEAPAASAEQIHEANIAVHRFEAAYYELFHPEVYSKQEQKRIRTTLLKVNNLVDDNRQRALDFGAGTGNLTDKLLAMGYTVTAIDISAEMCQILRRKHAQELQAKLLTVINSPIEDASFTRGEFDLVCGYSVLHHLPDYTNALRTLSGYLKKGGVMYMDHEASPFYWKDEHNAIANMVKDLYFHSNPLINSLHFQVMGVKFPSLDYTLSDYWHKKEHSIDHQKIAQVFKDERFEFFKRTDYYLTGTWIFNPLYPLYRRICRPEMSSWIAKK